MMHGQDKFINDPMSIPQKIVSIAAVPRDLCKSSSQRVTCPFAKRLPENFQNSSKGSTERCDSKQNNDSFIVAA